MEREADVPRRPRENDVRRIAQIREPWCVTVYGDAEQWTRGNHPTETAQLQIRTAADRLRRAGAPREVIEAVRDHLGQACARSAGAAGRSDPHAPSVAIFATDEGAEELLLTGHPAPAVSVGDRFVVAPMLQGLLPAVPPVLALVMSANEVRLVDVGTHPARVLDVPGLPSDLANTIPLDLTGDRDTWAHLRISEDHKERLHEYARAVDRSVQPLLRRTGALLVIAAAEPLASIYRATTSHGLVASTSVVGNHDGASLDELANLAAPVIDRYRRDQLVTHLARLHEAPDRRLVLADIDAIDGAARAGAIDTLFVDVERDQSGPPDAQGTRKTPDLVEEILGHALASRATIIPVGTGDLPGPGGMAALLRYAPVDASAAPFGRSHDSRGADDE
jgi:hypothetical protein